MANNINIDLPSVGSVTSIDDALSITNTGGGGAILCRTENSVAVLAESKMAQGVNARSEEGVGVTGSSVNNAGVSGHSSASNGMRAIFDNLKIAPIPFPVVPKHNGLYATSTAEDGKFQPSCRLNVAFMRPF